jgi:hypothetical protein
VFLPDVQEIRPFVRALKVRFRAEVALGRFDDAIRTAKTLFAISRHVGDRPTLIASLMRITAVNAALGRCPSSRDTRAGALAPFGRIDSWIDRRSQGRPGLGCSCREGLSAPPGTGFPSGGEAASMGVLALVRFLDIGGAPSSEIRSYAQRSG